MTKQQNNMANDELPYNIKNVLLDEDALNLFLKTYDVVDPPRDIGIYRKAMTHKSYITRRNENFVTGNVNCPENCLPLQEASNERLEYLGDAFLGCVVAEYLYERYPDQNEGFLSKMRTKLVNGKMLAHLCKTVGLQPYILLSKQIEESDGRKTNLNILEDTFEAFIGAITRDYGDRGFEVAKDWIINVIETHIDFSALIKKNTHFKDLLLKHIQQNHGYIVKFYEMSIESSNERRTKTYKLCAKDDRGNIISLGVGGSRKEAENDASYNALKQFGLV